MNLQARRPSAPASCALPGYPLTIPRGAAPARLRYTRVGGGVESSAAPVVVTRAPARRRARIDRGFQDARAMMLIPCPHCGPRAQIEFTYAGDATALRPE